MDPAIVLRRVISTPAPVPSSVGKAKDAAVARSKVAAGNALVPDKSLGPAMVPVGSITGYFPLRPAPSHLWAGSEEGPKLGKPPITLPGGGGVVSHSTVNTKLLPALPPANLLQQILSAPPSGGHAQGAKHPNAEAIAALEERCVQRPASRAALAVKAPSTTYLVA